jgi:hypothetical protein
MSERKEWLIIVAGVLIFFALVWNAEKGEWNKVDLRCIALASDNPKMLDFWFTRLEKRGFKITEDDVTKAYYSVPVDEQSNVRNGCLITYRHFVKD